MGCRIAGGRRREGRKWNTIHSSILKTVLMTGVASFAFMTMGAAKVLAETVIVQGGDGPAGEDGVNPGDPVCPGATASQVTGTAGSMQPITAPLNKATVTGGNGGQGGNGLGSGAAGAGGNGGAANSTASTAIVTGAAKADANSFGGSGGVGGVGAIGGNGGSGGAATTTSVASNADSAPVVSNAVAEGGAGGSAGVSAGGSADAIPLMGGAGGGAKASGAADTRPGLEM